MSGQQCTKTGLWILDDFRTGFRIATTIRGPLDPPERLVGDDPAEWSRYDTRGSTVYISDTEEIAFAEVLSGYALKLGARHPMQKDADFQGMTLDVYMRSIAAEWGNHMGPGFLAKQWRDLRSIYKLTLSSTGWWVDVEHPDSIAAISAGIGEQLHTQLGLKQLTLGVLHGEDRVATTMVSTWIRQQVLVDGSRPLGLRFKSKHGGGGCWAYWLRRRDDGLDEINMTDDDGAQIHINNPSLQTVAKRFGIKVW